jgi:hypothetical protein
MSPTDRALTAALEIAISQSPAVLTFVSGSTTVSASVKKSYTEYSNRQQRDAGYEVGLDNMFVMARTGDVSSWGLKAQTSNVSVDGVPMCLGQSIGKTVVYWKIWLRQKDS